MDKDNWFDYWFQDFDRIQQQTMSSHEDKLKSLFTTIRAEVEKKNSEFRKKLEKMGLDHSNSLFQMRIMEYILLQLNGIIYNISLGLYYQVIREMRFLLESWALAYYIDHHYPLETLTEKIEKNDNNLRGNNVFRKAFAYVVVDKKSKAKKQVINQNYLKFSKYYKKLSLIVHGTVEELKRFDKRTRAEKFWETMLSYRKGKVELCIKHLEEVHERLMILFK